MTPVTVPEAGVDRHAGQHGPVESRLGFESIPGPSTKTVRPGHAGTCERPATAARMGGSKTPTPTTTEAAAHRITPSGPAQPAGCGQRLHEHARYCQGRTHQQRRGGARCAFGPDELDSMVFASGFRKISTDLSRANRCEPPRRRAQRNTSSRHPRMSAMVTREIDGPYRSCRRAGRRSRRAPEPPAMDSLLGAAVGRGARGRLPGWWLRCSVVSSWLLVGCRAVTVQEVRGELLRCSGSPKREICNKSEPL